MQTIYLEKITELKNSLTIVEEKLGVKLEIKGHNVSFSANNPLVEYEAEQVLNAIGFGFSAQKALLIKNEEFLFEIISIKDYTKRSNIRDVVARVIGTNGRTKRTIETVSGCNLIVNGNNVGIIGEIQSVEDASLAIKNLISGSKQSNVYNFLEKQNVKRRDEEFAPEEEIIIKEEKE